MHSLHSFLYFLCILIYGKKNKKQKQSCPVRSKGCPIIRGVRSSIIHSSSSASSTSSTGSASSTSSTGILVALVVQVALVAQVY